MPIQSLIRTVAYGGNPLMNVVSTSRGSLDARAVKALKVYEDWIKYNGPTAVYYGRA